MFLGTDNDQSNAIDMGFHHDADGLRLSQARNGLEQRRRHMFHRIEIIVMK